MDRKKAKAKATRVPRQPRKKPSPTRQHTSVYFRSVEEMNSVRAEAAKRGKGFTTFIRDATLQVMSGGAPKPPLPPAVRDEIKRFAPKSPPATRDEMVAEQVSALLAIGVGEMAAGRAPHMASEVRHLAAYASEHVERVSFERFPTRSAFSPYLFPR